MKTCDQLGDYLAQLLDVNARAVVEAHLQECSACRAAAQQAEKVDKSLRAFLLQREFQVSPLTTRRLPDLVKTQRREQRARGVRTAFAGMAAATLALVLIVARRNAESPLRANDANVGAANASTAPQVPKITLLFEEGAKLSDPTLPGARHLDVPGDGRLVVRAGEDIIGLGARSQAELPEGQPQDSVIRLASGVVAVQAAHRSAQGSLSVRAGGYTVRVVGTRFVVTWDGVSHLLVGVSEGVVRVVDPHGGERSVRPGQQMTFSEQDPGTLEALGSEALHSMDQALDAARQPASPAPFRGEPAVLRSQPSVSAIASELDDASIKQLILEGAYARAERALLARVGAAPRDAAAWWLLGECRRKAGQSQQSVSAYRRLIEVGGPAERNRARYQAALILEERLNSPAAAIELYRAYLAAPAGTRPLEASAQLRLSRLTRP